MQSHVDLVPPKVAIITPVAQPTPDLTLIASTGQLRLHAPHSIQASRSTILALALSITKTPCGQTSVHLPQPIHLAVLNSSVTTFFKYRNLAIVGSRRLHKTSP